MSNSKSYAHQDWTPCVLQKTVQNNQNKQKHVDPSVIKMAKLDKADDIQPIEKVSDEDRKLITKLRVEKKLTQEELCKALNLEKKVINHIELGQHLKNKQLINRIKNYLEKLPCPGL